jgi:hypothetical protein
MITQMQLTVISLLDTLNGESFIVHNIIIVHINNYCSKEEQHKLYSTHYNLVIITYIFSSLRACDLWELFKIHTRNFWNTYGALGLKHTNGQTQPYTVHAFYKLCAKNVYFLTPL